MSRFRIDWENLEPLKRKRPDGATREDLAARKFNMGKARHKGRNHLSNQKRRQIALTQAKIAKVNKAKRDVAHHQYKARVRAYWMGEADEHP